MRIKFFNSKIDKVKSENGFTFVELIFVTIVTGILSSSLMLPLLNSVKQGTRPEIYATATYCAEKEIEELKNAGYTIVADPDNDLNNDLMGDKPSDVTLNGRTYYEASFRDYVSYDSDLDSFIHSDSPTEYIRITETVSNSENSDVFSLWAILAKDFYDPVVNPL